MDEASDTNEIMTLSVDGFIETVKEPLLLFGDGHVAVVEFDGVVSLA